MFAGATSFNQNIGGWDVYRVLDMGDMFNAAPSFAGHNLTSWCVIEIASIPSGWGTVLTQETRPIWGTCPGLPGQASITSPAPGALVEYLSTYVFLGARSHRNQIQLSDRDRCWSFSRSHRDDGAII